MHLIPVEIRFHVDPGGLTDVIDGLASVDSFRAKLLGHWYRRTTLHGEDRGFHALVDESSLVRAVEIFEAAARYDSVSAARRLMSALFDPLARECEATSWVEMTPPNILKVSALRRIFPGARFVHVYRDGRDVAHSVAPLPWGPDEIASALSWWEQTLVQALCETSKNKDAVLLVAMEDLVLRNRTETLRRIVDFLQVPSHADIERYFDEQVLSDRAHIGRWKKDLSWHGRRQTNQQYRAATRRIVAQFPDLDLVL